MNNRYEYEHPYPSKFSIGDAVEYIREELPENYEVIELEDVDAVEIEPNIKAHGTVYREQYDVTIEEDTIATISFDYWSNPRKIRSVQMELKGNPEAEAEENIECTFEGVARMLEEESSKRKQTSRDNSRGTAEVILNQR